MDDEPNFLGRNEKDGPLTLRAFIHHTWMSPAGRPTRFLSLYPGAQYRSTEDLHAFDLALKERLSALNWRRVVVVRGEKRVEVRRRRTRADLEGAPGKSAENKENP